MKKIMKKMFNNLKGAIEITGVVIDIVLVVALIPVIVAFVNTRVYGCVGNISDWNVVGSLCHHPTNGTLVNTTATLVSTNATETTLLALTTLFIVLALVFSIVKQSGLMKKK